MDYTTLLSIALGLILLIVLVKRKKHKAIIAKDTEIFSECTDEEFDYIVDELESLALEEAIMDELSLELSEVLEQDIIDATVFDDCDEPEGLQGDDLDLDVFGGLVTSIEHSVLSNEEKDAEIVTELALEEPTELETKVADGKGYDTGTESTTVAEKVEEATKASNVISITATNTHFTPSVSGTSFGSSSDSSDPSD